jgi:hypothetical protein
LPNEGSCGHWVQKLLGNLVLTKASGSRSIVGASIKEPFHVIKKISIAIYGAFISYWEELLLGFIVLVSSVRGGREHLRGKASSEKVGQKWSVFPIGGQCEVFGLSIGFSILEGGGWIRFHRGKEAW